MLGDLFPENWSRDQVNPYLGSRFGGRRHPLQSRFTEIEIVYAVKQVELGSPVREIARKYGVSDKTVYTWRRRRV